MDNQGFAKYRLLVARLFERAADHFRKLQGDNFNLEDYLPHKEDRQELARLVREHNGALDGWMPENAYSDVSYYSLLVFFAWGFKKYTPQKKNDFEAIAIKYRKLIARLLLSSDPDNFYVEDYLPNPKERLELRQLIFEKRSREFYGENFKDDMYEIYDDNENYLFDTEYELKAFFASVLAAI